MTLDTVLAGLYASEINCSISCFWDGGWDVKLGDEMNGFVAEAWGLNSVEEIAIFLHGAACRHYPESDYAKQSAL